ncbi:MAG: DUF4173 domain-containing protein [Acidimicrobiales bacterium]
MSRLLELDRRAVLEIERGPDRATWVAVAVAAVGTDLAVRSGVTGLAGAALVAGVSASLLWGGRLATRGAMVLALAAPVFGLGLAMRTSPGIVGPDMCAAAGLLVLACSMARYGDPRNLSVPGLVVRGLLATAHGVAAPGFLARGLAGRGGRLPVAARGLALAVPVALVLGALLGAADPVFASFFRFPGDPFDAVVHVVLLGVGAWGMAGLLRLAAAGPPVEPPTVSWRLGRTEATTVLTVLVLLFLAFSGAQVFAALGGADTVLSTAGLTYAEYARSGFFQLLAVAALTLGVLMAVRAAVGGLRGRLLFLSEVAVGLTIVVVAVALRRLWLYDQAFGLTMLRLSAAVFAAWVGAVFVLLGLSLAGVGRDRAWLVPAALAAGLALLAVLNVANPEALVVRRNLAHAEAGGVFDAVYVASLSDDAVPTLLGGLDRLGPDDRADVLRLVCGEGRPGLDRSEGFWAFNRARHAADAARNRTCGAR